MPSVSYKVVVVGASGAGKTALLQTLLEVPFDRGVPTTIGVDFISWPCEIDGQRTKLQIWDTAGQERFKSVAKSYIRGSIGAILVFDVTSRVSFEAMTDWVRDVTHLCLPNAVFLVAANKTDLADQREVSKSEYEEFTDRNRLEIIETSALTGQNVKEVFLRMAHEIWARRKSGALVLPSTIPEPSILADDENAPGCHC
jgi:small GTP-binding protein